MKYNLCDYRYSNGKIYKRWWWFIFDCIDNGPHTYMEGVKIINNLCGLKDDIIELQDDISPHLELCVVDEYIEGVFLVNFKCRHYCFDNDPMPAYVEPYGDKRRLLVTWENGWDCIATPEKFNVYKIS